LPSGRIGVLCYQSISNSGHKGRIQSTLPLVLTRSSRKFFTRINQTLSRNWFPGDASDHYAMSAWLFLRILALIYFFEFISLAPQVRGLIGRDGILPVEETLRVAGEQYSVFALLRFPTLFWYGTADFLLTGLCGLGLGCSVLLFAGFFPAAMSGVLFLCFLSFSSVAGPFFSFIGDRLLLETGLLSMFVTSFLPRIPFRRTPNPPKMVLCLFWWLLFRVPYQSAMVELIGDTPLPGALSFSPLFYQNQTLPSYPTWVLHQWPDALHWMYSFGWTLFRLIAPVCLVMKPQYRRWAAFSFALFQVVPFFTGNYTIFSLLVLALCLFTVDDACWIKLLPAAKDRIEPLAGNKYRALPAPVRRALLGAIFAITGASLFVSPPSRGAWPKVLGYVSPFGIVNHYEFEFAKGELRPELSIEGSADGEIWKRYEFRWKPEVSKLLRPPLWTHHPRLDWQMARAAREEEWHPEWLSRFCHNLLKGSEPVTRNFEFNPFHYFPPRFVRIVRYEHRFADTGTDDDSMSTIPPQSKTREYIECE
jgi:hypothetical protein